MKTKLISLIAAVLMSLGVMTVFRACPAKEDVQWMHCHTAQMDLFYVGIALVILALAAMIIRSVPVCIFLYIVSAVLGCITLLVPGKLVSMCMMENMRCWSVMRPFAMLMGILVIVFSLINLIRQLKQGKKA